MRTLLTMLDTQEAHEIICQAYTYGYPLVLMDVARQLMTDVSTPDEERAPPNQFAHATRPTARHGYLNTDVISSAAWLTVGKEPVVLSLPHMGRRYYSMQLTDAWTNVSASISARTSHAAGHFAIVGPRWTGHVPAPLDVIESPTSIAWLSGSIETSGEDDCSAVHRFQRELMLVPLGLWSHGPPTMPHAPTAKGHDVKVSPSEYVARMGGGEFFERLNALLLDNPPGPDDEDALNRFLSIGVGPGLPFDIRNDALLARSVDASAHTALARIVIEAKKPSGRTVNGWWTATRDDDVYMTRAVSALVDPGAPLPEDLVTLRADADGEGRPLSGADRYVLRFRAGQIPPVSGFWSIAMYTARQALVDNPIERHAIGSRDQQLAIGSDGSVTVHIQHTSPGRAKASNWLPAPHDQFVLIMRLYWPTPPVLDGVWTPPAVERVTKTRA